VLPLCRFPVARPNDHRGNLPITLGAERVTYGKVGGVTGK